MAQFHPFINYKSPYTNSNGGLFNYDETTRENLVRFPMDPTIVDAITRCLKDMPEEVPNKVLWPAETWPALRPYSEMFKSNNFKVDPYIYLLNEDYHDVQTYPVFPVTALSTFASVPAPYNSALGVPTFWSDDNILKVKIRDCNSFSTEMKGNMPYGSGNWTSGGYMTRSIKNYKTNFPSNTGSFKNTVCYLNPAEVKDKYILKNVPSGDITNQNVVEYKTDKSLYDYNDDNILKYSSISEASMALKGYSSITWLGNRMNDQDGKYSPLNERAIGTKTLYGRLTKQNEVPLGRYVFFVEINNNPWWNNNGTPDDFNDDFQDNTLPPKQYIMFNALSLISGSFQALDSQTADKQFTIRALAPNYNEDTTYTGSPSYINGMDTKFDRTYMGLGTVDGKIQNPFPSSKVYFIPPFPYYIRKYTPYFDEKKSKLLGITYNDDIRGKNPIATITGTSIYSNDTTEFESFFNNGLGITATTNYEDYKTKNTKEWIIPEPPEPPIPPIPGGGPGSGGQIGGNPGGGTGTGGTPEGDESVPIQPPTNSTGGAALYNQYAMDPSSVQGLQECMVNNNIWDAVKNAFKSDFKEGIVNLIQFPYDIKPFLSNKVDETVKVIGVNMDFEGISHFCKGIPINKNIKTLLQFGQFDIKERFGSFLDYEYTTLELYIPFIGKINLDTKSVMGRRIKILVDVDYNDGSCLATIWVTNRRNQWDKIEEKGYYPLSSHSGQIGTKISLAGSDGLKNTLSKLESVVGVAASTGLALSTGGLASGLLASTAVGAGISTMNTLSNPPTFNSGSPINSNHTLSVSVNCVLTAHYPETNFTPEQAKISGFSTHLYDLLGNQTGFTMCDNVKLNGIKCTDAEANEIKTLLQEGVIINE